jgi:hypothetical protein
MGIVGLDGADWMLVDAPLGDTAAAMSMPALAIPGRSAGPTRPLSLPPTPASAPATSISMPPLALLHTLIAPLTPAFVPRQPPPPATTSRYRSSRLRIYHRSRLGPGFAESKSDTYAERDESMRRRRIEQRESI